MSALTQVWGFEFEEYIECISFGKGISCRNLLGLTCMPVDLWIGKVV